MAETGHNRKAQKQPKPATGDARFGSPAMPMLAAGAAARLASQVISRLQSPHALPGRAPHPTILWREVTRRLGYAPIAARADLTMPRSAGNTSVSSPYAFPPATPAAPPVHFVWRTQPVVQEPFEPDLPPWRLPSRPNAMSATRIVGESQPVPLQPILQVPAQDTRPPLDAQAPPTFTPAVAVRIEYVPTPAAIFLQPVAPALPPLTTTPIVPTVQRYMPEPASLSSAAGRTLSTDLNRALVPTTDLLSRMVRPAQAELPSAPTPITQPVPAQAAPLPAAMPLAQPQASHTRVSELTPAESEPPRPAMRGQVGRMIERIVEALPLPEGLKRLVQAQPPPEQMIPPAALLTQPIASQAAQTPSSLPQTAHHDIQSAPLALPASESASTVAGDAFEETHSVPTLVAVAPQPAPLSSVAPSQDTEIVVSRGPSGLLSALLSRLRGDVQRTESPGPAPLTLSWTSRSQPVIDEVDLTAPLIDSESPSSAGALSYRPALTPDVVTAITTAGADAVMLTTSELPANIPQIHTEHAAPPYASLSEIALPSVQAAATSIESTGVDPVIQVAASFNDLQPAQQQAPAYESHEIPVWETLPEMAQQVAEAHTPLPDARPLVSVTREGLVARLLARLGISAGRITAPEIYSQPAGFELVFPQSNEAPAQVASSISPSFASLSSTPVSLQSAVGSQPYIAMPMIGVSSAPTEAAAQATASSTNVSRHAQRATDLISRLTAPLTPAALPVAASRAPSLGVLRSPMQMLRFAQIPSEQEASDDNMSGMEDYIEALSRLYYPQQSATTFPLAIPYAGFAAPTERPSYFAAESDSAPKTGAALDYTLDVDTSLESPSSYTYPTSSTGWEAPALSARGEPVGWLTDYSWGEASDSPSAVADAGMWADVIATAAGGPPISSSGNIALALAGEERSAPSGEQRPPNEDRSLGPNLDDLAETIYSIIRQRLAIERERTFT